MKNIRIEGIDGSELLGFLAGLGILRVLSVNDPSAALSWKSEEDRWNPILTVDSQRMSVEWISELLEGAFDELGSKTADSITLGRTFIDFSRDEFRSALKAVISRWVVTTSNKRNTKDSDPRFLTHTIAPAVVSAFGSDSIIESEKTSKIRRTPISLSNGQGGQNLLKDVRSLAGLSQYDQIMDSLRGNSQPHTAHSLNWHPSDYRPAAYRWSHSVDDKPTCDPVLNTLAFVGLSYLPVIPDPEMAVPGISFHETGWEFTWPLWAPPLESDRVAGLVMQGDWYLNTPDTGVVEVRQTATVRAGSKRRLTFVTPSRRIR